MKSARVGAIVLICLAAIGAAVWFLRSPPSLRYAARAGNLSVMVMLRGAAHPVDEVTVDVAGVKLVAHKVQ
jgi:hypothetical protein